MPDQPLVSIVTPSYNQAAFLEKAILSVLEQDYPALEYFVMDGGSNDGSAEIICKYADRLKGWASEPDRGQADGINKGFARASGEIIAWLNSDDYYLPGAVSAAVKALQENPACGMIYGDVVSLDGEGRPIHLMRCGDWGLDDLMRFNIIGQPAVFMRRPVLQKTGFSLDTRFHFLLDHQLWIRMARTAPIRHLPRFLAAARYHEDAKNVAQARLFGQDAYALVEWMRSDPDYAEPFRQHRREIEAAAHWFNARYLSVGGDYGQALGVYVRSILQDPRPVLKDWKRFGMTVLAVCGLRGLYPAYLNRRRKELSGLDWDILNVDPADEGDPAKNKL